jgi:hypothetical protein
MMGIDASMDQMAAAYRDDGDIDCSLWGILQSIFGCHDSVITAKIK